MRPLTLITALLGLTQGISLPVTPDPDNNTEAFNTTPPVLNYTAPELLERRGGVPWSGSAWPPAWQYKPTPYTEILVMRFRGKTCAIPRTLRHEERIQIAPEGYEENTNIVCKQFKKENAVQSLMLQFPDQIMAQGSEGDRGSVHYHGPLHHCRIVVYPGHFCDGVPVATLTESDELECRQAFGGHSMRAACWK